MTEQERKVLDAAREWLLADRTPRDWEEKALALAVARAFPEDMVGKESCTCGEQDDCDECMTTAQIAALIASWERDSIPIAEAGPNT